MRKLIATTIVGCALGATGCRVTGSWRTASIDPPGAPFPLDTITFGSANNYTASWEQDGRRHTGTGNYRFNGLTLKVLQGNTTSRTYDARLRLDGSLVLTYREGERKVSATLEKDEK